jgi:hypothetical protein
MRRRSVTVIGFSTWRQVPGARASPPLSVSVLLVVWSSQTLPPKWLPSRPNARGLMHS